jgi:hypothetical protein
MTTAKLIAQIDTLTAELDDCQAEKAALDLALAASVAYGQEQHARALNAEWGHVQSVSEIASLRAERDAASAALRARITEVHTLNARLLIAQGGQL